MRRILSKRWRHEHRRGLRIDRRCRHLGGPRGHARHRRRGRQRERRAGVRGPAASARPTPTGSCCRPTSGSSRSAPGLLVNDGRLPSSAISPNGKYLAALTWNDFTGFLTIINLKTNKIVQQVGTGATGNPSSATARSPPTARCGRPTASRCGSRSPADLVRFSVAPTARSPTRSIIPLVTAINEPDHRASYTADLPSGMALSSDGSKLYVALNGVNQLGRHQHRDQQADQGHQGRQRPAPGRARRQQRLRLQRGRPPGQARAVHQPVRRDAHRGQQGHRRPPPPARCPRSTWRPARRPRRSPSALSRRPSTWPRTAPSWWPTPTTTAFSFINTADGQGRADGQRQPAAGLHRRQLPERDHDAQPQHDPGQHRAGQRPGRLRLQRPDDAGEVRGPAAHRLLPGQRPA